MNDVEFARIERLWLIQYDRKELIALFYIINCQHFCEKQSID